MPELIADIVKKIGSLREFSGREVLDDIRNLINQFFIRHPVLSLQNLRNNCLKPKKFIAFACIIKNPA